MTVYENCCQNFLTLSQNTEFLDVPSSCQRSVFCIQLQKKNVQMFYASIAYLGRPSKNSTLLTSQLKFLFEQVILCYYLLHMLTGFEEQHNCVWRIQNIIHSFSNVCWFLKIGQRVTEPLGRDNQWIKTCEYQVCLFNYIFPESVSVQYWQIQLSLLWCSFLDNFWLSLWECMWTLFEVDKIKNLCINLEQSKKETFIN